MRTLATAKAGTTLVTADAPNPRHGDRGLGGSGTSAPIPQGSARMAAQPPSGHTASGPALSPGARVSWIISWGSRMHSLQM